jgi:hypothetical protein
MITLHRRESRLIFLMMIGWGWAAESAAQTVPQQTTPPPSLLVVSGRVPLGATVHVTDAGGSIVKGSLFALTVEAVQVEVGDELHTVSAGDVRRVQWQQPDSPLTGVIIGAAIGAIPGIYWLASDPNECTGMCPEEYALIAVGAIVGGLIDRAITKRVTVFDAGVSSGSKGHVSVRPLVQHARKGVRVAVTF